MSKEESNITTLKFVKMERDNGWIYTLDLDGDMISKAIYKLSINPLRIIGHILKTENIKFSSVAVDEKIVQINVDSDFKAKLAVIAERVLEMRCFSDIEVQYENIIRQLPFNVAMSVSDEIARQDEKHAIYASSRGGYNIKTLTYDNRCLDHFCYTDSNVWD